MRPGEVVERLRARLAAPGVEVDLDEAGDAVLFVRRDMLHLDADALNDRLAAWTARELHRALPAASAFVSFRHASPATLDDAELDWQERWLGLQPMLRLDLAPPPTEADLERFCEAAGRFLALVDARGRPAGWRRADEGGAE